MQAARNAQPPWSPGMSRQRTRTQARDTLGSSGFSVTSTSEAAEMASSRGGKVTAIAAAERTLG
jgi:hypothetical protein